MRSIITLGSLSALVLLGALSDAQGTWSAAPPEGSRPARWSFELLPYLWLANLDGTLGLGSLPEVEVEAGFGDLLENLDFAAAGFFIARKGPWVVLSDVSYTALDVEETVGASDVDIDSVLSWASLSAGYTLAYDEYGSVDLFAGARYTAVNNDGKSTGGVTASHGKNEDWLDPLVGFNARRRLFDRVEIALLADAGGFGVGSDFTYEVLPGVSYALNEGLWLRAGYRWMDTDFEDDDFKLDVVEEGWIVGLGIVF